MRRARDDRGGFALLVVLLVLLALLVLAAPFLTMASHADQASTQLAQRQNARLALDSAANRVRDQLGDSHPSGDGTPYFDSLEEIAVDNKFDPKFLDANDPTSTMWDVERKDVAGLVDLGSAPPQMIANLIGASTRFAKAIAADEKELPLASSTGFEPSGFLWCDGELIRTTKMAEGVVTEFKRGMLGPGDASHWKGGPTPPIGHAAGAPVLDQRAFAIALWRLNTADGEVRRITSMEELTESTGFALVNVAEGKAADGSAPEISDEMRARYEQALRPLSQLATVHGGVRGGAVWQHPARLSSAVQGGKDGMIRLDSVRWVNPGTTLQISDGVSTELAIVQEIRRDGVVVLDRILANDYEAYLAIVRVLARRPVNINTAQPEVLKALFANLQVVGRNSRITRDEAAQIADLVVQSRPFTGFEDFLERIVLPAAGIEKLPDDADPRPDILADGSGFIDALDALALYRNGLNANDGKLLYSTMPYAFVTRDVYDLELRAAVNAPSGVERFSLVRDQTELVVPQRELMALWARQEDFDEALRLDCEAPWWATGPKATSRYDDGATPPSRIWAQMGTYEGQAYLPGVTDMSAYKDMESPPKPEHVFASRDEAGWIQLWPSRMEESSDRLKGRVLHFDQETRDPEGRYLPDQVVARATDDKQIAWTAAAAPLCRPLSLSLWIKPRGLSDATYLDVAGTSQQTDRVELLTEGDDLVLRVLDATGDHLQTTEKEAGEARFKIAAGPGPGLPVDVWSHVDLDVRGNRPDQIHMLVNGLAHGVRTPGLSRLGGQIPMVAAEIPVESTEGFPQHCTVRIGNELFEVTADASKLSASRMDTGEFAGFGGCVAREEYNSVTDPAWGIAAEVPANLANIPATHAAGTPVELYGYSLPLLSDLPTGAAQVAADIGPFRVARLAGVSGTGMSAGGEPIQVGLGTFGLGMEGANSHVSGLVLESADAPPANPNAIPAAQFMPAFHSGGGYAALVQVGWHVDTDPTNNKTAAGTVLGGIEIIRYSGWTGTTLNIAARGDGVTELKNLTSLPQGAANYIGGRRAFVAIWDPATSVAGVPVETLLAWRTYVVPISLAVPNASNVNGYLAAKKGDSRFAQLTHVSDAENTEWVRYDWFETGSGQLVRDDYDALLRVYAVVTQGLRLPGAQHPPPNGGGNGPPAPTMFLAAEPAIPVAAAAVGPMASAPAAPGQYSSQWDPRIGKSENAPATYPITAAVEGVYQFRGVFGTYTHTHKAGTKILPVFMTNAQNIDGGRPGRMDAAFLVGASFDHPGWPVRVHLAHRPSKKVGLIGWKQDPSTGQPLSVPLTGTASKMDQDVYLLNRCYIALQDRSPEIMVAGSANPGAGVPITDTRGLTRITCFPSGERPRIVTKVSIGGGSGGASGGAVPSAVVDEIAFGDAQFARPTPNNDPESFAGASLLLTTELDESGLQFTVAPGTARIAIGDIGSPHEYLSEIPEDSGLLQIGEEILAYDKRDPTTGDVAVANNGRGLLGTRPQAHHTTEPVAFLEHHIVTFLASAVGASDSALMVADTTEFPMEGTVLVGSELIHYTRLRQGTLEMPRASSVPGHMDNKGGGLFRGRFGTTAEGHAAGEAVILFPFRYWDRWAPKADAPELAYFELALDQPSAFWSSCFFLKDDAQDAQVGVLQKSDPAAPWDADPDTDKRLALFWQGDAQGAPMPIGTQSDRVAWRVFVKYGPGAFDLTTGLGHGWKQSPRLRRLGAFYFGPGLVLGSVER